MNQSEEFVIGALKNMTSAKACLRALKGAGVSSETIYLQAKDISQEQREELHSLLTQSKMEKSWDYKEHITNDVADLPVSASDKVLYSGLLQEGFTLVSVRGVDTKSETAAKECLRSNGAENIISSLSSPPSKNKPPYMEKKQLGSTHDVPTKP